MDTSSVVRHFDKMEASRCEQIVVLDNPYERVKIKGDRTYRYLKCYVQDCGGTAKLLKGMFSISDRGLYRSPGNGGFGYCTRKMSAVQNVVISVCVT